jgi:hypothetical protein
MLKHLPQYDMTRNLILAPPLTGCTTLAGVCPDQAASIDCDVDANKPPNGTPLYLRKRWLADLIPSHATSPFFCVPTLPGEEYLDMLLAVVIIPAGLFVRRWKRLGPGHRVAALTWRDEAVAFATRAGIVTCSSLMEVPALQDLRVPLDFVREQHVHRGIKHEPTATRDSQRPENRTGRHRLPGV